MRGDLVAVDVGNSKVLVVLLRRERERARWRYASSDTRAPGAVAAALAALGARGAPACVASVEPRAQARLVAELRRRGLGRIHAVGARSPWPFRVEVRAAHTLGADRLCNVAGLVALGVGRGVAVDVGTAITCDVLADGSFVGGAILPGVDLSARALCTGTARLPGITVPGPVPLLGRDTRSAMAAGAYHGTLAGAAGLARALATRLGGGARILTTGAGGRDLRAWLPEGRYEPDLLVLGLRALADRVR